MRNGKEKRRAHAEIRNKGASIYDVRTQRGEGSWKNRQSKEAQKGMLHENADKGGRGVKKSKTFLDVINGRPIRDWKWLPLRDPHPSS